MAGAIPKKISVLNPCEAYKPPPTPDINAYVHKKYNKHRKQDLKFDPSPEMETNETKTPPWRLSPPPTRPSQMAPPPRMAESPHKPSFRPPERVRTHLEPDFIKPDPDESVRRRAPGLNWLVPSGWPGLPPNRYPLPLAPHPSLGGGHILLPWAPPGLFSHPVIPYSYSHERPPMQPPLNYGFHIPPETTLTPVEEPKALVSPMGQLSLSINSPPPSDDTSRSSSEGGPFGSGAEGGPLSSGPPSSIGSENGARARRSRKSKEHIPEWVKVESIDEFKRLNEMHCPTDEEQKAMVELRRKIKNRDAAQRSRQKRIETTSGLQATHERLNVDLSNYTQEISRLGQIKAEKMNSVARLEAQIIGYKENLARN